MRTLYFLFLFALSAPLAAQVAINQDNSTPDPSAMLEVKSSERGLLIPRMTSAERDAIANPAAGLIIYNTQDSCFNYFTGQAWVKDCGRSLAADQKMTFSNQAGGIGSETGYGIATDFAGNVFVTGFFAGTATFGDQTVTGAGAFIVKYDASGNVLWLVTNTGTSFVYGLDVATDASGNVYVTGVFENTVTFGGQTLTSAGGQDLYVLKFDPAGNLLWAYNGGGSSDDIGYKISTDNAGNVFVAGWFSGTTTFGDTTLSSAGEEDALVVKLDASGNVLWAVAVGGTDYEESHAIATDAAGNAYATGYFNGTITVGSTTLTATGSSDIFIVKYDPSGNVLWAVSGGGTNNDSSEGIATDAAGNVYVTGAFSQMANFGGQTVANAVGSSIFIVKYDASGNVVWATNAVGTSVNCGDITTDASGNVFVVGNFANTTTSFGGISLTSGGNYDVFIAKYDASGNAVWAVADGGSGFDQGLGIATDASGKVYATGDFRGTADFGGKILTSAGVSDVFVVQYTGDGENAYLQNNLSDSEDHDTDPTNEIQNLSFDGATLSIDGGNSVVLPFWSLNGNAATAPGTNFIGTTDNAALDFRVNNKRAFRLEYAGSGTPSPNVIGGASDNAVSNGMYGSTISGGKSNTVTGNNGTVAGGTINSAANGAFVGGGESNTASGMRSIVAGGYGSTASGDLSTVSGGSANTASGVNSIVSGGSFNYAGNSGSAVIGGHQNTASGFYSAVAGGEDNEAAGIRSFAAGRRAKASHDGAFVWADNTNSDFISTAPQQFLIRASGGVGVNKNNPASALDVNGTVTATAFAGDGSALSGIPDDQTLGLSGTTLSIEDGNSVDLSGIDTDTDDQTLNLSGTTLSIEDGNSVDLSTLPGDNLGSHIAAQNINLNGNYLSGDGGNEGVLVYPDGNVRINSNSSDARLEIPSSGDGTTFLKFTHTSSWVFEQEGIHQLRLRNANTGNKRFFVDVSGSTIFRNEDGTQTAAEIDHNTGSILATNFVGAVNLNGNYLSGDGDNEGVFVDAAGNVGIGNTNPTELLHVGSSSYSGDQSIVLQNASNLWKHTVALNGSYQIKDGDSPRLTVLGTNGNVGIGFTSPVNTLTVGGTADFTDNVGIGTASPGARLEVEGGASVDDYVAIIHNTSTDPDNDTRYNGLRIQAGKVNNNNANSRMIGFYNPNNLEIGSIRQNNSNTVSYNTSSDIRLKQNIVQTGFSIDDLMRIEVRDYEFRAAPGHTETGFIAQQLYTVYPGAVSKGGDDVTTDPWMVDYGKLTPLLVKAVQDQQATIEAQQKRIAELEARVAEVEDLKAQNAQMAADIQAIKATLNLSVNTSASGVSKK
ncbi:MAG: tail fiber domain-containing protein [Saprospiraceae bacterium]